MNLFVNRVLSRSLVLSMRATLIVLECHGETRRKGNGEVQT